MNKVLSLQEFIISYVKSHPHDKVKKVVAEGISVWQRLSILLAKVAVNILSASHTIPVIVETTSADSRDLKLIVAIAAFIAIEFTMILFVVFGRPSWIRTSVIIGALLVAVVANYKHYPEHDKPCTALVVCLWVSCWVCLRH